MTPKPSLSGGHAAPAAAAPPGAGEGPFVINLCSSTTPMALAQPQAPELRRFSFFVSRRLEDRRERFRLHMGYFETLAEAEEWLSIIREIYPGAWAGEAPGKRLRERAAAEAAAQSAPPSARPRPADLAPIPAAALARASSSVPVAVQPTAAPPVQQARPAPRAIPPAAQSASPAARPAPAPARAVPTIHAAPAAKAAPSASTRAAAPPTARPAPVRKPAPQAAPPVARQAAAPAGRSPQAKAPISQTPARNGANGARPALPGSNVREVLASLDGAERGQTRIMPAPAPAPKAAAAATGQSLSDTQVLRILENRRSPESSGQDEADNHGISLLKPDDTGTRRALKEAVSRNAAVSFAVQLQWSVQPVELDKVPPLAIFSAYTLYTVEGSREGRRWYGLRLGFFSDAISAKQVAHYVRSEFASVAVVPVSPQERTRATEQEGKSPLTAFAGRRSQEIEEFKLIDDEPAEAPAPAPVAAAPAPKPRPAPVKPTPAGRRSARPTSKVRAREQRAPQTLEETLEILGASELEIDNGSGEVLNDTGVRHLRVEVQKNTPFSRLLDRLSERVRKS